MPKVARLRLSLLVSSTSPKLGWSGAVLAGGSPTIQKSASPTGTAALWYVVGSGKSPTFVVLTMRFWAYCSAPRIAASA